MVVVELSAEYRIRDESDVLKYYWNFLTIALPLLEDNKLTDNDFNAEFFKGFHLDGQDILADQVFNMIPRHPANQPFDIQDVLSAACQYFASDRFTRRVRKNLRGRSRTRRRDPERPIQRLFGDKRAPKRSEPDDDSDSEQEEDDSPAPRTPDLQDSERPFQGIKLGPVQERRCPRGAGHEAEEPFRP